MFWSGLFEKCHVGVTRYPSPSGPESGPESDGDRNQIMKSNEFSVKRRMIVLASIENRREIITIATILSDYQ